MSRFTRSTLLASVAVLATVVAPAAASAADAVMEWNLIAQGQTIPLRPTAHGETRGMAMVAGAMYDAVNAIERGHEPYLLDLDEVAAQPWASQDAAAATAAHHLLVAIAPLQRPPSTPSTPRPSPRSRTGRSRVRVSAPARPPRRRCSTSGRMTDSWPPSTSAS